MAALGAVVLAASVGCVPDEPTPSPFACAADPVVLGNGDAPAHVSADGNLVVIQHWQSDQPGIMFEYDLVDRRAGTNRPFAVSGDFGDGLQFWSDPFGTALVIHRLPPVLGDAPRLSRYDVATGTETALPWNGDGSVDLVAVSSDLKTALMSDYLTNRYFHLSLETGEETPLPLTIDPALSLWDVSPSADRVVVATTGLQRSISVIDVVTNSVVASVVVDAETNGATETRFLDDATLLVDGARPAGTTSGPIATDDAFVFDLATATATRVDAGLPWSTTRWASVDGTRSRFVGPPSGTPGVGPFGTYIRGVDPAPRLMSTYMEVETDAALTLAVVGETGTVTLTCF